jgi:predicted component of type VI protein secretion system
MESTMLRSVFRNVTFIGLLAWYSDMREDQSLATVSRGRER